MMPGWRCLRIAMSEWSWDAPGDSMERTCARAVEMGLPAVAFTEHADYTTWKVVASDFAGHEQLTAFVTPDGTLTPPRLDLDGSLECVQRCRDQFPNLRVISGVELGEAHRHSDVAAKLLDPGQFDRVLASLHTLPVGQQFFESGIGGQHGGAASRGGRSLVAGRRRRSNHIWKRRTRPGSAGERLRGGGGHG
jgi:hypothetical protein